MRKTIGILGGGPAGLHAAILLAEAGHPVVVYDHRIPFEKPCGGGITSKAFHAFPILGGLRPEMHVVDGFEIIDGDGNAMTLEGTVRLHIVSRKVLGRYLLERALQAGVRHVPEKVVACEPAGDGFRLRTETGGATCDFLIGADGAQGPSRRWMGAEAFGRDRFGAMGYYVDGLTDTRIKIKFYHGFSGYLWTFPRPGHASVGIGFTTGEIGRTELNERVRSFLAEHYPGFEIREDRHYAATIPFVREWRPENVQGRNWALVGDAGGFTDAITGEGIFYAFRSGEILARAILRGEPGAYFEDCRDIREELAKAYRIMPRFYQDRNIRRMVATCNRSPFLRDLCGRVVAGEQSYRTLKGRLVRNSPRIAAELLTSLLRRSPSRS